MAERLLSIMSNCYNEEENVDEFYRQISEIMACYQGRYAFELIFIDNSSTDGTVAKIKAIIARDRRVRLIVNARNFGQVRSPYHGLLQAHGDAVVSMATDLQDPPEVIKEFIRKWEEGYKNVVGVKTQSEENRRMFFVRKVYYNLLSSVSEAELIKNFTGFGLYDRKFIEVLRQIDEPYPYFRGLIAELGSDLAIVPYTQPLRQRGKTKNNFFTLYEIAMLGFVNHSKLPLRLASFVGFGVALFSFLVALIYLVYKILFWDTFQIGIAPVAIGLFFLGGIQLFFLGIIGEYIGAIFVQVRKRPLVVEKERVNFD